MTSKDIFAKRLLDIRMKRGLSRQKVADDLEITRASLEYYEKGKRTPDMNTIVKIAKYFNTTTDYLTGLFDIETTDKDLQFVCEYTGLSEKTIKNFKAHKELSDSIKNSSDMVSQEKFGILCNGITAHDIVDDKMEDFYMLSYKILRLLSVYSKSLNKVDDEIDKVLQSQDKEDIISSRNNIDNYIDVISGIEFSISQMAVKIANDFCCKEKQEFEEKVDTYYKTAPLKIQKQLKDGESGGEHKETE